MRYVLTSLLVLMAAVVLFATGCERVAQAPADPGKNDAGSYREDVAEVIVTAERPGWLMPEVVVCSGRMPEVVVHASWSPTPVTLSVLPSADFVN